MAEAGSQVVDDLTALAGRGDGDLGSRVRPVDRGFEVAARHRGRLEVVLDAGDRLLQCRGPRGERRDAADPHTFGQDLAERAGQHLEVDRLGELDVEVLGVALVTDAECQSEADLRSR